MPLLVDLFRVFTVLNLLLLAGLGYVWARNWLQLRSKHTLGLLLFVVFLAGENLLAAYFFMIDPTLSTWIVTAEQVPPVAQGAMTTLRVLEFAGLAFLTWVTYD
ncbi:hypothetical protein [Natronomonas sp. EA1]|uniref:hypothetical protein n=1 Tax=Natronomonas sp. EA1 TaxID=3421655 RepID=UPI003EB7AADE